MIETIILNWLNKNLDVPAYLEEPEAAPKSFVLFEKVGSRKDNHLNSSTFAFQSYAPSMYEAVQLNAKVKQAVERMINLDEIANIKLNSDYNFTDTKTKRYRYQAVFDFKHY